MSDIDFSKPTERDEIIRTGYLQFNRCMMEDARVTEYWEIYSTQDYSLLGSISWFGRWRKYAFAPAANTRWDAKCLKTITAFIEGRMAARRR